MYIYTSMCMCIYIYISVRQKNRPTRSPRSPTSASPRLRAHRSIIDNSHDEISNSIGNSIDN